MQTTSPSMGSTSVAPAATASRGTTSTTSRSSTTPSTATASPASSSTGRISSPSRATRPTTMPVVRLVLRHLDLPEPEHHRRPTTDRLPQHRPQQHLHDNVTRAGRTPTATASSSTTSRTTQNGGTRTTRFQTLVENNLVYENGGKGIQVHLERQRHRPQQHRLPQQSGSREHGTWRGELSNQDVKQQRLGQQHRRRRPVVNRNNTAIGHYGPLSDNTVWDNNMTFNGTAGQGIGRHRRRYPRTDRGRRQHARASTRNSSTPQTTTSA